MTDRADQPEIVAAALEVAPDAAVVSNLGVASWVLQTVEDRPRNFYMRGAMGGTTPTGLGLALTTDEDVVVFDGDGSLLMSLGCLVTVGEYTPANLTIVVLNNAIYETTGGQPASQAADFAGVARECGLDAATVTNVAEFTDSFEQAVRSDRPTLLDVHVTRANIQPPGLGIGYNHAYITNRFREALAE